MTTNKPKPSDIFYLRCPNCHSFPLRKGRHWFEFHQSCGNCRFKYEREPGYFTGAIWMVNYTLSSLVAIICAAFLLIFTSTSPLSVVIIVGFITLAVSIFLFPYARAIWMFVDLRLKPLEKDDFL